MCNKFRYILIERNLQNIYVDVESVYARNFWKVVIDEINIYPLIPVIYWFRIREKTFKKFLNIVHVLKMIHKRLYGRKKELYQIGTSGGWKERKQ